MESKEHVIEDKGHVITESEATGEGEVGIDSVKDGESIIKDAIKATKENETPTDNKIVQEVD